MRKRTEDGWIKSLETPLLVIGNGVLPCPIPENDYVSIVRLNNYVLGGWSGYRVTHWVTSGYKNIRWHPVTPALIPWSDEYQRRGNRYDLTFGDRVGVATVHTSRTDHIRRWFPSALLRWQWFPSLGFCFLALLNEYGIKPDIIGFDGMKTGHQSNPLHRHGHGKTKALEWDVISSLFITNNLNGLADYVI